MWELYHVAEDLSETHDLAAEEPERLAAMIDLWWEEARRNDVLPLDNRPLERDPEPAAAPAGPRSRYVYRAFGAPVPEPSAVHLPNRAHTITAEVEIATGAVAEGVLLAMGSALGGFSLYLREGRLRYVHNLYFVGTARDRLRRSDRAGRAHARVHVHEDEGTRRARASCSSTAGSSARATSRSSRRCRSRAPAAASRAGTRSGPAVGDDYEAPFRCNATIRRVVVDVEGEHERDPMAVFQAIMSEQ